MLFGTEMTQEIGVDRRTAAGTGTPGGTGTRGDGHWKTGAEGRGAEGRGFRLRDGLIRKRGWVVTCGW